MPGKLTLKPQKPHKFLWCDLNDDGGDERADGDDALGARVSWPRFQCLDATLQRVRVSGKTACSNVTFSAEPWLRGRPRWWSALSGRGGKSCCPELGVVVGLPQSM